MEISSPTNPRVKRLVARRRARDRARDGVTVVEGEAELRRAVEAGATVREAYRRAGHTPEGLALDWVVLGPEAFDKAAVRGAAAGVLAVVDEPTVGLDGLALPREPLVLVTVGMEKPGNLGAMLRTADAVGVDAVIVADPLTDVTNPNVVRASLGCLFTVPVAVADGSAVRTFLSEHGIAVVAALVDAEADLWATDLTGSVAVVVGPEHEGLPAEWAEGADRPVRIPMAGSADSLNASVSAAVVLYEAARQRSTA